MEDRLGRKRAFTRWLRLRILIHLKNADPFNSHPAALLPILLAIAAPAHAAEVLATTTAPPETNGTPVSGPPADAKIQKKWEFATIGYIFFAGAYGSTKPRDPLPQVDVHLTFGDVIVT